MLENISDAAYTTQEDRSQTLHNSVVAACRATNTAKRRGKNKRKLFVKDGTACVVTSLCVLWRTPFAGDWKTTQFGFTTNHGHFDRTAKHNFTDRGTAECDAIYLDSR